MNDTYLESLESPLSVDATQMMHISRMSDYKQFEGRKPKRHLAGGIWISKKIHISRKLSFCPFIWHLNQEKWARNNKILFV